MTDQWQYQIRITLSDENAKLVRFGHLSYFWFKPIVDILSKHNATLVCQFDAFSSYVEEAEEHGVDEYPLYAWTKETIENPTKEEKYIKSFSLHVDGEMVYEKAKADALEVDLLALVACEVWQKEKLIRKMFKYNTNPANQIQPPIY